MKPIPLAIFASGSGTTAEAFLRHTQSMGNAPYKTQLVICNSPTAGILNRITGLNQELGLKIETIVVSSRTHPALPDETTGRGRQTAAEEAAILELLHQHQIELIVLMGYMKRIGPSIVQEYGWLPHYTSIYQARMLNTHPGLLPATKGLHGIHVQDAVLAQPNPVAGQTLHIVADAYDEGPTVAEHPVPVETDDTPDILFARVQIAEKGHIAADVAAFITAQANFRKEN